MFSLPRELRTDAAGNPDSVGSAAACGDWTGK